MSWDTSDPVFMGCVLAGVVGMLLLCVGMDMRKLPLGRVKLVPWTGITMMLFFVLIFVGRTLLRDVVAS